MSLQNLHPNLTAHREMSFPCETWRRLFAKNQNEHTTTGPCAWAVKIQEWLEPQNGVLNPKWPRHHLSCVWNKLQQRSARSESTFSATPPCTSTRDAATAFAATHPGNQDHAWTINFKKTQTINSEKPKSLRTTETFTLAKVGGLAKSWFGQSWFGQSRFGQSRFRPAKRVPYTLKKVVSSRKWSLNPSNRTWITDDWRADIRDARTMMDSYFWCHDLENKFCSFHESWYALRYCVTFRQTLNLLRTCTQKDAPSLWHHDRLSLLNMNTKATFSSLYVKSLYIEIEAETSPSLWILSIFFTDDSLHVHLNMTSNMNICSWSQRRLTESLNLQICNLVKSFLISFELLTFVISHQQYPLVLHWHLILVPLAVEESRSRFQVWSTIFKRNEISAERFWDWTRKNLPIINNPDRTSFCKLDSLLF